ncbi:hypothetical protein CARUB_v10021571mg [Capsella rubella]|uniref:RING-type domain-containing protein n=1 Tax=Capsella rubella TaxID=81985 RepID=R0HTR6_9BRAS|nr:hypothetical protein CARUB_v10021571mg [Capsella rubella]
MKSRLCNLKLYKFDVPFESDVGVMVLSFKGVHECERFQLTRYTGRKQRGGSKAGLSKAFIDMVDWSIMMEHESHIANHIFDYIVSNFSFKDLDTVPPACPVLVFHFQTREFGEDHVPHEIDIASLVLSTMRTRDSVLSVEEARARLVPIAPPTTEIVDCYQRYPKEDEIVHKTKCNHIFHATCISRYLLHTPRCPLCSVELPPVDIRTLLFF